jgi:hypothetical protein
MSLYKKHRVLVYEINWNLSEKGNKIGQEGLRDFLLSVQYQITLTMFQQKNNSNFGLLKLNLSVI